MIISQLMAEGMRRGLTFERTSFAALTSTSRFPNSRSASSQSDVATMLVAPRFKPLAGSPCDVMLVDCG